MWGFVGVYDEIGVVDVCFGVVLIGEVVVGVFGGCFF